MPSLSLPETWLNRVNNVLLRMVRERSLYTKLSLQYSGKKKSNGPYLNYEFYFDVKEFGLLLTIFEGLYIYIYSLGKLFHSLYNISIYISMSMHSVVLISYGCTFKICIISPFNKMIKSSNSPKVKKSNRCNF